jgi:hypothetical protein
VDVLGHDAPDDPLADGGLAGEDALDRALLDRGVVRGDPADGGEPVVGMTTSAGNPAGASGASGEEVMSSEIGFSDMAPSAGVDAERCAGGRRPNDPRGSLRPAYRFRGILRPA